MEIKTIPLTKINPAVYNPRLDLKPGDLDYEKIRKSIEEFDLVEPLVWNKRTRNLVGGHQRLKILKERGDKTVEVSVVDLDAQKEKALNLALNKIQGDWDYPRLKDLLEELDIGDMDIDITGFDEKEIEELMTQFHVEDIEEDEVPEPPKEAKTKPGEIIELGRHRLMCGDATKREDVEKLMAGKKADMVMADPPYNVGYVGGSSNKKQRADSYQDSWDDRQYSLWLQSALVNANSISQNDSALHLWFAGNKAKAVLNALENAGWQIRNLIIWNKLKAHYGALGAQYKERKEPMWYAHKKGQSPKWFGETNECTVWDYDQASVNELHPTMKPVGLYARSIKNHTRKDNLVYEAFGGSGTTLIACEQLNRTCYMMEIDPKYCDVIVERYNNYIKAKNGQKIKTNA